MRRAAWFVVPAALGASACSDEGAPVVAGDGTTTATSAALGSTTAVSVPGLQALDPALSNGMLAHLSYDGDRMCVTLDPAMGDASAVVVRFAADGTDVVDLSAPDHCSVVGAEAHVVVDSPSEYLLVVTTPAGEVSGPLG